MRKWTKVIKKSHKVKKELIEKRVEKKFGRADHVYRLIKRKWKYAIRNRREF